MILTLFADSHEQHRDLIVPAGDILICAGDFTMFSKSLAAIEDFNDWLGELSHPFKIVVPGNHEYWLETDPARRSLLSNAQVLIDEAIVIDGLKIYGSPTTPLYGAAFGKSSPRDRERHWALIPHDTNVLITHGPPLGLLDGSPGSGEHMGDPELRSRVRELPALHFHAFGHIHGAHGSVEDNGVRFSNVTVMGEDFARIYQPQSIRMAVQKT